MTRPKLIVVHSDQASEPPKSVKKYRFEVTRTRLALCILGFAVSLCWVFFFGVLVGRGVPVVSSSEMSLRAEVLRFLGLDREEGRPAEQAASTWTDPKQMMQSLNYYQDLQKGGASAAARASGGQQDPSAAAKDPAREAARRPAATSPVPLSPDRSAAPEPEKAEEGAQAPAAPASERFTVLVASLRDFENAQRLIDQLRSKGYSPRLETLDLNGGGRWNRVLIGSFQDREAALRFATDFNRKEKKEGLVIRESN